MPIVNVRMDGACTVTHPDLVNLYGCSIGAGTRIGPFVEIQKNCRVGARCKISSHAFLCEGVSLGDAVFIGHGVMFTNELYPRATNAEGALQTEADWTVVPTRVGDGASIGSNATIVAGVAIGRGALVAAGAVVTRDVPDFAVVAGVPARVTGDIREKAAARHGAVAQGSLP